MVDMSQVSEDSNMPIQTTYSSVRDESQAITMPSGGKGQIVYYTSDNGTYYYDRTFAMQQSPYYQEKLRRMNTSPTPTATAQQYYTAVATGSTQAPATVAQQAAAEAKVAGLPYAAEVLAPTVKLSAVPLVEDSDESYKYASDNGFESTLSCAETGEPAQVSSKVQETSAPAVTTIGPSPVDVQKGLIVLGLGLGLLIAGTIISRIFRKETRY